MDTITKIDFVEAARQSVIMPTHTNGAGAKAAVEPQPEPSKAAEGKKPPVPTDLELAERWLAAYPDTAWGLGEFRRYENGVWEKIDQDTISGEIIGILEAATLDGVRPTLRLLNSVMGLGRIKVSQRAEVWDADHDILVCKNGALHIPTRTLLPHSKEYYATSGLPYDYDPEATAPTWEYVLDYCIPDAKDFLQEFAGYALTTDTQYEIAVWLAGLPGGGKSTIIEGLQAMLMTRVCRLGLADIERSRFALTSLPGKTLAISTEQPEGYVAAGETLKSIISGEMITVERKFRDPVDIVPRVKLVWAMERLPRVGADGGGLFRRVKVIRLPSIPESKRDPQVKERIKLEGAGILNWALDGLARLRERGRFEVPTTVQKATSEFRETNDIPAAFVSECCVTGEEPETGKPYRAQSNALYTAYSTWCKENGHKAASSTSVATDWERLGFEKRKIGTMWWYGVGIREA